LVREAEIEQRAMPVTPARLEIDDALDVDRLRGCWGRGFAARRVPQNCLEVFRGCVLDVGV
jgi:hypothetical protein